MDPPFETCFMSFFWSQKFWGDLFFFLERGGIFEAMGYAVLFLLSLFVLFGGRGVVRHGLREILREQHGIHLSAGSVILQNQEIRNLLYGINVLKTFILPFQLEKDCKATWSLRRGVRMKAVDGTTQTNPTNVPHICHVPSPLPTW